MATTVKFLSIKWKILLALGGVMLSVSGAMSWLHLHDLKTRFESERAETRARLVSEALALRSDAGLRLQALAGMLAAVDMVGNSLFETAAGKALLRQHFDNHWSVLQLELGVESLQVFARTGTLLASWSSETHAPSDWYAEVTHAVEHERAIHWTRCQNLCTQFAAAPILSQGRAVGAIVVGSSLADVVLSFQRLTGADLGVLAPADLAAANGQDKNLLHTLGLRVLGLSNAERNLPLLQALDSVPPLHGDRGWRLVTRDDREVELSFLVLDSLEHAARPALLVVIDDLTTPLAEIRRAVGLRLGGELVASTLSLLLLAILVRGPLQRMTRAVQAIPLLGRSAFAEVRGRIIPRARRLVGDEIDGLDEAAISLSYRLEALERDVAAHSAEMQGMLRRISVERDFSRSLLSTAQVIVLTQDANGHILTLNRYGCLLSGWSEDQLVGKSFLDLVSPKESSAQAQKALQEIVAGFCQHVQLESLLLGTNGESYEIIWNHSRLSGADDEVIILSVGVDHTERKRAESHVSYLAEHDPLTGLVNRQHFQYELSQALLEARRSGEDGALLYLDLDGFKYVNDLSGHQAGDALLRIVADEVASVARSSDLLGRLGGDELGLLLRECDQDGAVQVAEKINRRLAEIRFPGLGANHRISASIGVVIFSEATSDVKQLLANADIAMYQAKSKGGTGWHLYCEGEGVQEKMQNRLLWEGTINRALSDRGLVVHFQPILDIRARQVSHYEALVRIRAVDGTTILPGMFMEVAENSGLVRAIDRQVIHLVCSRMLTLFAHGRHYRFSINLSGASIDDPALLPFISEELARHPLLPSHLVFEITETAAVSDFAAARTFMHAVCDLGCEFALDDFGVGFSSFNYVKQLPVDYVKIDGSFVRTLVDRADDQVFVRALAEVARGFGKKTVAEFVEDERSLNMLRAYGVDYAQGYYIGKPAADVV